MFVLSKQLCMNMESSCLISSRHYHLRPFGKYLRGKSKANFELRKKGKHVKHNAYKGRSAWTDSNCVLISHEFTFIFMAMRCMYIWGINGERNNHKFDSFKAIFPFYSRWKLTAFHDCEHFNRKKINGQVFLCRFHQHELHFAREHFFAVAGALGIHFYSYDSTKDIKLAAADITNLWKAEN